jgi:hypothetical protein
VDDVVGGLGILTVEVDSSDMDKGNLLSQGGLALGKVDAESEGDDLSDVGGAETHDIETFPVAQRTKILTSG